MLHRESSKGRGGGESIDERRIAHRRFYSRDEHSGYEARADSIVGLIMRNARYVREDARLFNARAGKRRK